MERLIRWSEFSRIRALVIVSPMLAFAVVLDYLVGEEIVLAPLYILPPLFAALATERWIAYILALVAAGLSVLVESYAGVLTQPLVIGANTLMRFAAGALVVYLGASLRTMLQRERQRAYTDPLTGIANRRHFLAAIAVETARASRLDRPLVLAYIDVDDLKKLNDTHGHSVGDKALQLVATVLHENLRPTDVAGRIGGDEFALLLGATDAAQAHAAIARLMHSAEQAFVSHGWPLGLSVGVVTFSAPRGSAEQLLMRADEAMYRAKAAGKHRAHFETTDQA